LLSISKKRCIFVAVIQKDMSFIKLISREQLMLPNCMDEYVSQDIIVRFIDAFVDKVLENTSVELLQKGKSIEGHPSYSPNCLCKLLI
jgi:transposase